MSLVACGVNHEAPLALREQIAVGHEHLPPLLSQLKEAGLSKEVSMLSTCNRTEIYCDTDNAEAIAPWLSEHAKLPIQQLHPHWYCYQDDDAVRHILRVACGLDSMVLGESEILSQMKAARECASQIGTLGPILDRLFQHSFATSKRVRTDTALGSQPISVAYIAVSLAKRLLPALSEAQTLLIGTGDTIRLVARHLQEYDVTNLTIAGRTQEKADALAIPYHGRGIAINDLQNALKKADILITATSCPIPILGPSTVRPVMAARSDRPLMIVDLAVPRDIEPEVGSLENVHLYSIDDLQSEAENNLQQRRHAANHAEEIIELEAAEFMAWLRSLNSVDVIRQYRHNRETIRDQVLAEHLKALGRGEPAEEVLAQFAHRLTNKILHPATTRLREASRNGDTQMMALANKLFATEED